MQVLKPAMAAMITGAEIREELVPIHAHIQSLLDLSEGAQRLQGVQTIPVPLSPVSPNVSTTDLQSTSQRLGAYVQMSLCLLYVTPEMQLATP